MAGIPPALNFQPKHVREMGSMRRKVYFWQSLRYPGCHCLLVRLMELNSAHLQTFLRITSVEFLMNGNKTHHLDLSIHVFRIVWVLHQNPRLVLQSCTGAFITEYIFCGEKNQLLSNLRFCFILFLAALAIRYEVWKVATNCSSLCHKDAI